MACLLLDFMLVLTYRSLHVGSHVGDFIEMLTGEKAGQCVCWGGAEVQLLKSIFVLQTLF